MEFRPEPLIEIAVIVLAGIPVVRLFVTRPARRELRERPALAIALTFVAICCASFLAWAALHSMTALRIATVFAAAMLILAYFRARPDYGKSRGLPPGSLGLTASINSIWDERYYLNQAATWGPVFKMSQLHRPVVCIVDLTLGLEFLDANRDALRQSALPFARLIPGSYIEFMDGDHHARFRGILRPALVGEAIAECEPYVADVVRRVLCDLAASDDGEGVDPRAFLDRIALLSLLRVFFGVSDGDEQFSRFRELYATIDFRSSSYVRTPREVEAAFQDAVSTVEASIERIRAAPPGSERRCVLTEVLPAIPADDGGRPMATVIGNLIFLVAVARDDLQGFLLWLLKMSCDAPQWTRSLREADSDRVGTSIVKEALRLRQSEYVYRDVAEECRIGDYRIPKGWRVRVCLAEAHRLESVFPNPHEFDPGRFLERSYSKTEYCPFSDGDHACFGTRVVMTVSQTFLRQLATGFDWRSVSDGPAERGNRQWNHWEPSTRFRVALQARRGKP